MKTPRMIKTTALMTALLTAVCAFSSCGKKSAPQYTSTQQNTTLAGADSAATPSDSDTAGNTLEKETTDPNWSSGWEDFDLPEAPDDSEYEYCGIYSDAAQNISTGYKYSEKLLIDDKAITVYTNTSGEIAAVGSFEYEVLEDDNYKYLYFTIGENKTPKAFVLLGKDFIGLISEPGDKTEQTIILPNGVEMDAAISFDGVTMYTKDGAGSEFPNDPPVSSDSWWRDDLDVINSMFIQGKYQYLPDVKMVFCKFNNKTSAYYVFNEKTLKAAGEIMLKGIDPQAVKGSLNLADSFYLWGNVGMYPLLGVSE